MFKLDWNNAERSDALKRDAPTLAGIALTEMGALYVPQGRFSWPVIGRYFMAGTGSSSLPTTPARSSPSPPFLTPELESCFLSNPPFHFFCFPLGAVSSLLFWMFGAFLQFSFVGGLKFQILSNHVFNRYSSSTFPLLPSELVTSSLFHVLTLPFSRWRIHGLLLALLLSIV